MVPDKSACARNQHGRRISHGDVPYNRFYNRLSRPTSPGYPGPRSNDYGNNGVVRLGLHSGMWSESPGRSCAALNRAVEEAKRLTLTIQARWLHMRADSGFRFRVPTPGERRGELMG
jgi:hypothetical protein